MSHPLVLGLFDDESRAAAAARELRSLGVSREQVSIIARTHDDEGRLAQASGGSPGSEIEDSRPASRVGEIGAHLIAAVALVLPGIGPIVADGPLAAGLGEAAGHLAGGVASALQRAGLPPAEAGDWERRLDGGAVLIGVHVDGASAPQFAARMSAAGAGRVATVTWPPA